MKMNDIRYNDLSAYLSAHFPYKVQKISLNAGFTCPNRDGTVGYGGCTYCNNQTFNPAYCKTEKTVTQQLEEGKLFFARKYPDMKFLAYFQAYTNTYAELEELKRKYEEALQVSDVVGLVIGTRPDCVDNEKLDLIASYANDYYTWVEYGLQSIHNKTLKKINRGHDFDCFLKAYEKTKKRGINVCVHVIFGLWETHDEIMETAKKLAQLEVDGVKIHMLCALENTKLAQMYFDGEIDFMSEEEYVQTVCDFLEYLPETTTIHRLAGNGLKKNLIAPRWLGAKLDCLNKIDREFVKRNSYQGVRIIYK